MLSLSAPPYSEEMNVSPWHPQTGVRSGSCHTWRFSDRCLLGGCTFSLLPQETSDLLPVLRVSGVGSPPMPGPCWGFAPRDAGAPKVSHTGAADSCRQEHPWSCGVSWPGALWRIGGLHRAALAHCPLAPAVPAAEASPALGPRLQPEQQEAMARWPPQRWEQQNRQGEKTWARLKSVVLMVIAVRRVRDMNC